MSLWRVSAWWSHSLLLYSSIHYCRAKTRHVSQGGKKNNITCMLRLCFLLICLHKQLKRRMNNQTDPNAQKTLFFSFFFYGAQLNNSSLVGVAGNNKKKKCIKGKYLQICIKGPFGISIHILKVFNGFQTLSEQVEASGKLHCTYFRLI